jgi:hypothetical protein
MEKMKRPVPMRAITDITGVGEERISTNMLRRITT